MKGTVNYEQLIIIWEYIKGRGSLVVGLMAQKRKVAVSNPGMYQLEFCVLYLGSVFRSSILTLLIRVA